jgi:hypothetical protein
MVEKRSKGWNEISEGVFMVIEKTPVKVTSVAFTRSLELNNVTGRSPGFSDC